MERRSKDRFRVWFPVTIVTDDGEEGTAITSDVSATGLLMKCPGRLSVGAHVTLRFKLDAEDTARAMGAKVVRSDDGGEAEAPWRYWMAVEFDEPQPELEGLLPAHVDGD